MLKRAAIYARYSTEKQKPSSVQDQIRLCERWAEENNAVVVKIYTDEAVSGASAKREGLEALLKDAEEKKFDLLLVEHTSRLARDSYELQKIVRILKYVHGIRIVFVSQGLDTDREEDEKLLKYMALGDEAYIEAVRLMTKRSMEVKAKEGKWFAQAPFGYRIKDGRLEVDKKEAEIVRFIFHMKAEGYGYKEIARRLNLKGIRTKRGKPWTPYTVRNLLTNPIYKGFLIWNRTKWVRHPVTGRRIKRERSENEWIVVEQPELRIVSEEVWDLVNKQIRKGTGRRSVKVRSILSGIVVCGNCGKHMSVDRNRFYCPSAKVGACDNRFTFDVRFLELYVINHFRRIALENLDTIQDLVNTEGDLNTAKELKQVNAELEKVKTRINNILRLLTEMPHVEELKEELARLKEKEKDLNKRKEELMEQALFSGEEISKIISHLDVLLKMDVEKANTMMADLIAEIRIRKVFEEIVEVEFVPGGTRNLPTDLQIYNGCGGGI